MSVRFDTLYCRSALTLAQIILSASGDSAEEYFLLGARGVSVNPFCQARGANLPQTHGHQVSCTFCLLAAQW